MKKLSYLFFLLSMVVFYSCGNDDDIDNNDDPTGDDSQNEVVISFESQLSTPESEFVSDFGAPGEDGYTRGTFKDPKNLLEFNHSYSAYGFGFGSTYTNKTDVLTPGFMNISAITGKGQSGKVYITTNTSSDSPAKITNLNPSKYEFKGTWVTNSTYAYLAVKERKDGNAMPYVKQFANGDWFKLTAVGHKANGNVIAKIDFYLADYRSGKTEVVNSWKWFDWTSIKDADYITFEMSSTDNSEYGGVSYMNTPSYFCLDGITLVED